MTEIINLKTGKDYQEVQEKAEEERQNTISFLKELTANLEKYNLDPVDCIVMVSYKDSRDTSSTQTHDMFHTNTTCRDMIALIELVKHRFLNEINR